jgi:hypothetical protein
MKFKVTFTVDFDESEYEGEKDPMTELKETIEIMFDESDDEELKVELLEAHNK